MLAMTRKRPPHCWQVSSGTSLCPTASRLPSAVQIGDPADLSMSMANTRLRRCAQLIARCRSVAAASPRSATVRVLGTIFARSRLAGANTPWYLVKCARGFGTSATRRAIKSSGSTKSPGAILDSRRLARRAQGRMPGATSRAWCHRDTVCSPDTSLCPALRAACGRANRQSCRFVSA